MNQPSDAAHKREERVDAVLAAYLDAARSGEAPPRGQLLADHPDLAAELEAFFADEERFAHAAAPLRAIAGVVQRGETPRSHDAGATGPYLAPNAEPQGVSSPGRIGCYEVIREIGRGGMGVVYKARQPPLRRFVALKMMVAGAATTGEDLARFRREAEAVAQLQHPNVVQIFDVSEHEGQPFFSMEYLEGGNLRGKLGGNPQLPEVSIELMETLAQAMQYAHERGVVHRDLKPANILLTAGGVPKVSDFGLAKLIEAAPGGAAAEHATAAGTVLGTPGYMSPEQALGRTGAIGPASDLYSLGAILYEMLTGRPPFKGATPLDTLQQTTLDDPIPPRRLQPKVPIDLETICLKCLRKDPRQRYESARALADDLGRVRRGEPIRARPIGRAERVARWCRRKPLAASLLATLAALGLLSFCLVTSLWLIARAHAREADHQRDLQEEATRVANRQRDLYRFAYRKGRDAVDQFIRLSERELFDKPGSEQTRRHVFEEAIRFHEQFADLGIQDPEVIRDQANAYEHLGHLQRKLGDADHALRSYEKALDLTRQLLRDRPDDPESRKALASLLNNLGLVREDLNQPEQALHLYQESVAAGRQLVRDHPADAEHKRNLARALNNVGVFHHRQGRRDEALPFYREALGLKEAVFKDHPSDIEAQDDLATGYTNLIVVLGGLGKVEETLPVIEKALELRKGLVKECPDNPEYGTQLAMVYRGRGTAMMFLHRSEEAIAAYQDAVALQRAVLLKLPNRALEKPKYQEYLSFHLRLLARAQRDAGRPADAALTTLERCKVGIREPAELYSIACDMALCIPLVGKGKEQPSPAEQDERKRYADHAMEVLSQAVANGYRDAEQLRSDPALAPLRGREDFRKVVGDLAKPN